MIGDLAAQEMLADQIILLRIVLVQQIVFFRAGRPFQMLGSNILGGPGSVVAVPPMAKIYHQYSKRQVTSSAISIFFANYGNLRGAIRNANFFPRKKADHGG